MERLLLFHAGMPLLLILLAVFFNACGPSKFGPVYGFASEKPRPRSIDILPAHLVVVTHPSYPEKARAVYDAFVPELHHLLARHFGEASVVHTIDPMGRYYDDRGVLRVAMTPDDVQATNASLSRYGAAIDEVDDDQLTPYLPAPLGRATGSVATLYVGGWAYLGKDQHHGGGKGKWLVIGAVAVVAAIGVVILSKGKVPGGKVVEGAAKAVGSVAKSLPLRLVGRAFGAFVKASGEIIIGVADAMGRSGTHMHLCASQQLMACAPHQGVHPYLMAPAAYEHSMDGALPPSVLELEFTLVANQSGEVLWHARQIFGVSALSRKHRRRAVAHMLAALPAHY